VPWHVIGCRLIAVYKKGIVGCPFYDLVEFVSLHYIALEMVYPKCQKLVLALPKVSKPDT